MMRVSAPLLACLLLVTLTWSCSDDNEQPPKQDTGVIPDTCCGPETSVDTGADVGSDFFWPDQGGDATATDTTSGDTAAGDASVVSLSIKDIQDTTSSKHPAKNTKVKVTGIITAVDSTKSSSGQYTGFWIQEAAGGPYSGIYVYDPWTDSSTKKPVLDDEVEVTGTYDEYYDVSELKNVTWTSKGKVSSPPTPAVVAASDVANGGTKSEQYEGVLIQVSNIEVDTMITGGYGFIDKTSKLYVDIELYDFMTPTPPSAGTKYSKVTGPLHYSFNYFRILPRSAADMVK